MDAIPQDKIQSAAQGLRAVAHELRLNILCHLLKGPMCVGELMEVTGAGQSNLSQHLSKMRLIGILASEKRGQQVFYYIDNPRWKQVIEALQLIYCPEQCR
ncbi:MAG TPA: metalloregulator ArsR/SmtB family transcription factor [Mariprofundaceae bacterium]|nr:metalloregulator ArsR/SmtB family transcription factor [Mariprofundaceae bacterium]